MLENLALVHESDAMAALGLVEIRRGDEDGEALRRQVGEDIPELAARDGIDAGGWLVEQQDAGLRDQRTDERELLPHAAAQLSGEAAGEAVHVEHAQVLPAAIEDRLRLDAAQIAAVADVFVDGEVWIEAEGLGEVAGLRTHLARRPAEDVGDAGGRFHHAGENLEGRGLARAIGADEAEDLARVDCKADAAHGLERAVALGEAASFNGWRCGDALSGIANDFAVWSRGDHGWLTFGHVLPSTRTSPSTGIPGLANPKPDFNCSLMPTTCLTRSSRK